MHILAMLMLFFVITSSAFAQQSPLNTPSVNDGGWNVDGTLIALGYDDGMIQILDGSTYQPVASFQLPNQVRTLEWHPSNPDVLAVTDLASVSSLYLINVTENSVDPFLENHPLIQDFDWVLDNQHILLGTALIGNSYTAYPSLELWSIETGIKVFHNPLGSLTHLQASPDGQLAALAYADDQHEATIIQIDPYQGNQQLKGHIGTVDNIRWSLDGRMVATVGGYNDQTIRVWNADTGETIQIFTDIYADDLEWCPDNKCIATASATVQLLYVETGEILSLGTFDNAPSTIDFSPYGGRLLFAGNSTLQRTSARDATEQVIDGLHILIPAPTLDHLNAIAEMCVRDAPTPSRAVTGLASQPVASLDALPDFIAQVEALPADAIPAACRADLLAVAGALIAHGE